MRPGFNPTRRNRNIGTSRAGRGQDNRHVIPVCDHKAFAHYECLRGYRSATRRVGGQSITFIVETVRPGSCHACTVDDVVRVLEQVPLQDLDGIELIVMRQPTRKEEILAPVWGWLAFFARIDQHEGRTIFLESVPFDQTIKWSKSVSPDEVEELNRLRMDGHSVTSNKRQHLVKCDLDSVRATQLYRTLLHEIGHHVDNDRDPTGFDQRPSVDKERFAHSYARDLRATLEAAGIIPFERIIDPTSLRRDGLDVSDFIANSQ